MKKIKEQNYKATDPIFALVDHLNGYTSFSTNFYQTFEQAFEKCVEEYGLDELKSYFKDPKFSKSIKNKMMKVLKEIEIVEQIADHNDQEYIDFQDKLNEVSV